MIKLAGLVTMFLGCASFAAASVITPEISGATAAGALALLTGGILVLRGRRKR